MNDTRRIAEEAASWYLDMRDEPDATARDRFMAWLRHSPRHIAEYLAIARLHGDMHAAAALDETPAADLLAAAMAESRVVPLFAEHPRPQVKPVAVRRPRLRYVAAAASLLLAIGMAWAWVPAATTPLRYAADTGEVRMVKLPDDTLLHLSPGGIVDVDFDSHARRIVLVAGKASFDVGHDPLRPLSVEVGRQRIEDIGTVFDVDRDGDGARVAVISGKVSVWRMSSAWIDSGARRLLGHATQGNRVADIAGGESLHVDGDGHVLDRSVLDTSAATAWLPDDIRFHDTPIGVVARRFNAYTTRPLSIEDAALSEKRISGVFHAHDPEAFVSYLGSLSGVRVQREPDRIRIQSTRTL